MIDEFAKLRHKLMAGTRQKVTESFGEKEIHIVRAAGLFEDLDAAFNLLYEHAKEWYHYHFPELERACKDPEQYLALIAKIGNRKNFDQTTVAESIQEESTTSKILESASRSIGAEISNEILAQLQTVSRNALTLKNERNALEKFLETELASQTPSFARLAGTAIAAKMIKHTGSIQKLMELPASSLQILGAEKSFFEFLKNPRNANPPKHGYLFAHGFVRPLPATTRGKMARTLAAKLSIALKSDYYNPNIALAEELQQQLEKRFAELKAHPGRKTKFRPKTESRSEPPMEYKKEYTPTRFKTRNDFPNTYKPSEIKPQIQNKKNYPRGPQNQQTPNHPHKYQAEQASNSAREHKKDFKKEFRPKNAPLEGSVISLKDEYQQYTERAPQPEIDVQPRGRARFASVHARPRFKSRDDSYAPHSHPKGRSDFSRPNTKFKPRNDSYATESDSNSRRNFRRPKPNYHKDADSERTYPRTPYGESKNPGRFQKKRFAPKRFQTDAPPENRFQTDSFSTRAPKHRADKTPFWVKTRRKKRRP